MRRTKAKIPEDIEFATKPQLAQRRLERAWAEGLAMQWVVGDSTYGNSPTLREAIATTGHCYVLEIPKSAQVQGDRQSAQTVEGLVADLPADPWRCYVLNLSDQGLPWSDWTALRVMSTSDTLAEQWLVVRRTVTEPPDTPLFLSNAQSTTSLDWLAQVGGSRYPVEHRLEEAKGTAGLPHYEVRFWHSWYRPLTRALMAHSWLTLIRHDDAQKKSWPTSLLAPAESGSVGLSAEYRLASSSASPCLSFALLVLAAGQTHGRDPFSLSR